MTGEGKIGSDRPFVMLSEVETYLFIGRRPISPSMFLRQKHLSKSGREDTWIVPEY